jgi:hypothetical protein
MINSFSMSAANASRNPTFDAIVDDFINQQFKPPYFRVVDFPALPHGRRVIDQKGDELAVFYDYLTGEPKVIFPDKTARRG